MKDAPYLLDAILDNETELSILEHTTDTAAWNTVYMQEGIKQLSGEGTKLNEADFVHLSPLTAICRFGKQAEFVEILPYYERIQ